MFPRLTEQQLFNYWRILFWFNLGKKKEEEKILLSFQDLYTEIDQSLAFSICNIIGLFRFLDIDFKTIQFNKKNFLFWSKDKEEAINEFIKENHTKEVGKKVERIFTNNILKNDLDDIFILKKEINILLEYISFEIEDKDILKIKNFLKQYIQTFIKDNLIAGTHNFYNFKNQKKEMELLLISMTKSSKS